MKHKTRMRKNSEKIDKLNDRTKRGEVSETTAKEYHKVLSKIYDYESETLYKRDNPQRYIK